ncbi:MAG: hypothetical protein CMM01_11550 [Rhodopirellula sp.]|nr:hypothetical protein [Rhodopirellula sp.]
MIWGTKALGMVMTVAMAVVVGVGTGHGPCCLRLKPMPWMFMEQLLPPCAIRSVFHHFLHLIRLQSPSQGHFSVVMRKMHSKQAIIRWP